MKAAVYRGKQKLEVMDVDIPQPDVNEVLIKVKYCAICGTDVHAFMYDVPPAGTVMGHEFSGTIVRVGQEVTRLKEGMRVVGGGGAPPPVRIPAPVVSPLVPVVPGIPSAGRSPRVTSRPDGSLAL